MPKDEPEPNSSQQSRRSFLGKLGLALAGMAGASFLLSGLGRSKKDASGSAQEFPDEDSIFHPAHDPRLDPRRNKLG